MNTNKCPKCDAPIQSVKVEQIASVPSTDQQSVQGVSYGCPSCNAVLGIHMQHPSLQEEVLQKTV